MSLLAPFKDFHEQVAKAIDAGVPGLGQIQVEGQKVSLVVEEGITKVYGSIPGTMSMSEIKNGIIDDLVDDKNDNGAKCSKQGLISKIDFMARAEYYENRFLFPTLKDKRFASDIRAFAANW